MKNSIRFAFSCYISDIDECLQNTYTCDSASNCENTLGGYDCKCKEGYYKTSQGTCAGNQNHVLGTRKGKNALGKDVNGTKS